MHLIPEGPKVDTWSKVDVTFVKSLRLLLCGACPQSADEPVLGVEAHEVDRLETAHLFRVQGAESRVQDSGCRVQGSRRVKARTCFGVAMRLFCSASLSVCIANVKCSSFIEPDFECGPCMGPHREGSS